SSSLKLKLFKGRSLEPICGVLIDGILPKDHGEILPKVLKILADNGIITSYQSIVAVGHRVVHGGERYTQPTIITKDVIREIGKLATLAPLHNPANLSGVVTLKKLLPHARHVAVFDTAFHQTMSRTNFLYSIPDAIYEKFGVRKFGFHGTSHQYVFEQARKKLGSKATARTITCHLGNGCSITAIRNGKVIDTSMGFTPLSGVPMGTRSGDVDPAIAFHLMRHGWSATKVEHLFEKESGLLGMSGISSDMRIIWSKARSGNKKAKLTIERFNNSIAQYIGKLAVTIGGVDTLVFTAGEPPFKVASATSASRRSFS
ncbi:MAG: acetate/propionate family kinase, partial [Candidatus Binatota bacterium]